MAGRRAMSEKPSASDQLFNLGAQLLHQTLQNSLELGAAALDASSKLHSAALNATSKLGAAALTATSTLFPLRDRLHLEDAPVGVLHLDDSLRVLFGNPAAQALIGTTIASGSPLDQILQFDEPGSLTGRIVDSLDRDGQFTATTERWPQNSDPSLPIPIRVNIEPYRDALGRPSGFVAILIRLPLANLRLISETRTQLLEICAREQAPEAMLRAVLEQLRPLIPFDIATYYEHALASADDPATHNPESSSTIRRIRFAFDPQRPAFEWPMRWMSVPKVIDAWARGPQPWIDDLDGFTARLPASTVEDLEAHVSTQAARAEGLRAFLYFPLWEGDTIVTALSFAVRTANRLAPLHWEALNAIGLTQVLEFVRRAYERRSELFARRAADLFQSYAADPAQLARALVNEIAEEFRWDYVGIFRAARVEGHFRVLSQHDNTGQLTIDEAYLQPLDRGVLGTVLRKGHAIRISDVDTEGARFDYIKLGANKSCLCFPVFIGNTIEWIIDCESTQQAAFAEPDEDALRGLINNLQTTLKLWFEMQLSDALLEQIRQGAVITGANRQIERMNAKARQLFGMHETQIEDRRLDAFGADEYSRDVFNRPHPVDGLHLTITGADESERSMLASSIVLGENRWIWVFTDTAEQEWIAGLRYARATVEQVAAQARGPLMLAHSLIKRLGATIGDAEIQGAAGQQLFARILQTLSKADLTYERLAQALALRQQIEVGRLLGRFAERLSPEQRAVLWLPYSTRTVDVRGNPEALCRALADVFGHLDALRRRDSPIACAVIPDQDQVAISFTAALASAADAVRQPTADRLVQIEAAARFAAALPELARKIGEDQPRIERVRWDLLDEGGDLIETALPDGRHQLEIRLLKATEPKRDFDG